MLTTKLPTMHFAMPATDNTKLRVVGRSISLTSPINMNIERKNCVKSVLGEFSCGVSICPNKSLQSDLGPFILGSPRGRGLRGAVPPALRKGGKRNGGKRKGGKT